MRNIVYRLKELHRSFIYFHTLALTRDVLTLAEAAGKSIEVDVSVDTAGRLFVGHPFEFYEFKNMELPEDNLAPDTAIRLARAANLFIVIDCKDVRALPWAEEAINKCGAENVLFHSWVDTFKFEPYPKELRLEPHWHYEDLPFQDVMALKQRTGVPVISSARGLTKQRLVNEPEILDSIIKQAKGQIDVINFNLPDNQSPGEPIINALLKQDILTNINVDKVDQSELPQVFIGASDHIDRVSSL